MQDLWCPECGEQEYGLFDGYWVRDRLLEQVYFECRLNVDGTWSVEVRDYDKSYFDQFNEEPVYSDIKEILEDSPDLLFCPVCMDTIFVSEEEYEEVDDPFIEPIAEVNMLSGDDVIRRLLTEE